MHLTRRYRYLQALRNEKTDDLVWAPNFDYWLNINQAEGTVPEKYAHMSRNDIVRAVGGCIWNRAGGLRVVLDSSVTETWSPHGDAMIHEYRTPIGNISETHAKTEGECRARFIAEHFIKDLESLRVMKYVIEATHYEADYEPTLRALAETGDDGIVLSPCFSVPFIQFAKMDAGYINGFYLWMDHKSEVDSIIDAYFKSFLEGYRVLADGPADVIATNDNMDGTMISPDIFREYAIPFYQEAKRIISAKGKIFEGHWCGRTQSLLPLVPGCGLDVVEAIVTKPMANVELSEALDILDGKVVMQGGIPSVLVCEEGGSHEDFQRYIEDVVVPLKCRRGFILGMSDNVPPNADFGRIEAVAELIS